MPMFRRRPLMRAAMVGGGAYVAGKHVQRKHEAEAEQDEQISDLQQQQAAPAPAAAAPAAAAPAESREDAIAQLKDLKGLLDSGVLTQAEFDAQKSKILGEMP
jgi:membrane protease subunit (stomatin/prohibitin family)